VVLTSAELLQRHWGESVRQRRGDRTQSWLAQEVGCDQTTISRIERGIYKLGPELMISLAAVLGCELEVLFPFPPGLVSRENYERELRDLRKKNTSEAVA
jgi:DNA-binding XRE family transcriptional regulator